MPSFQKHHSSANVLRFYQQPVQMIEPCYLSNYELTDGGMNKGSVSQGSDASIQTYDEQIFTLDSSTSASCFVSCDSASNISTSPDGTPFVKSFLSDRHFSVENWSGSPLSVSSIADYGNDFQDKLRELEMSLLGPESDISDCQGCCFKNESHNIFPKSMWPSNRVRDMVPKPDLKQVVIACARAISDTDTSNASGLMDVLEQMVSVMGDPIQRLGAYLLEGLRARLEFSGSIIYRKLKCKEPTSAELMTSMQVIYEICPYWKFAYVSANAVITKVMENERGIHIVDFQIAQGSQWIPFIQALAQRPGGPPHLRITGIDDSDSTLARGAGLEVVGQRLLSVAQSCNVPFEFHDAAVSSSEVELQNLMIQPGEALAVNFPYILHHIPDESVSTQNHRDRVLRMIKSLSPKVVTLVEQESNTNTSSFFPRFVETFDYYKAMFESIDVARLRDDKQRITAEQNCVARELVNVIACEGRERMERHELFGKWRSRFQMAGFNQLPLNASVTRAVLDMLKQYHGNYRIEAREGALYLGWINRAMSTSSAWR
ncbi:scarecrow-like protein 21 [Rhodamnia argentea]|uniref:Scarecrow-like protein 21 n=1 Tax=Rhodamnia argentea TaxID=178133 RepID=A0A8B8MN92_9MYRT|nr:scarecrow-like protein 21 [Rhodamnia argentea]XP_030511423.1 scarecrow-like protein 21 [Rhodamnia argentea]